MPARGMVLFVKFQVDVIIRSRRSDR
ncbi:hypothetical protein [Sinorhizobium meliloti]|nr:hypothetical protein [Sinorhizobium meliloti]WGI77682.1 hypothetical protein QC756_24415 [Sinorhizobium meliloti]